MKVRESGMPDRAYWESLVRHCALLGEMDLLGAKSVFEFGVGYGSFLACFADTATRLSGLDIDPAMVRATCERLAGARGACDVRAGDFLDDTELDAFGRHDVCLLMNILHHDAPEALLALAGPLLEPGGRLGIAHWRDDIDTPRGPPGPMRVGRTRAVALAEAAGYTVESSADSLASPWHYYVVARRSA